MKLLIVIYLKEILKLIVGSINKYLGFDKAIKIINFCAKNSIILLKFDPEYVKIFPCGKSRLSVEAVRNPTRLESGT
jgi:hypothetical protein